ncbi:MAG: 5-formaminoimidazole-4-carboxamide-1-(Beta)-D-ribofuranosyl 5'-monophosphate synthetase [Candidatus Thorarchaeota archaeon]|nr:MAG: 5-formaminoimidazole-4-carboxamide-1-(Beta)-D-ribofuranosyl 5'-monophosphate synthetase [Candidatus Thorarchaeota archaeon]
MKKPTIGMIGSHSAEEIGVAAKANGFETVVVCQKGRDKLYSIYNNHLYDHIIVLDKFGDIINKEVQDELMELDTLWIPNRSFSVYVGYDEIETKFEVPIYGNRSILRVEERGFPKDQYWLLEQSGIRIPKQMTPDTIDRLAIVKVQQKNRPLERAFFYVSNPTDYDKTSQRMIDEGLITEEDLRLATVEEFIVAPRFNANFQAYAMNNYFGDIDLVGFDDRVQTNLSGLLNLPAEDQMKLDIKIVNEEVGHKGVTMRESKKPLVYEAAELLLTGVKKHFPPRMIGLFSLQGAITKESEFVVFDLSPRVPGAPCVGPTSPEMRRLSLKFKRDVQTPMDLCMIDIARAAQEDALSDAST